MFYSPPPPPSTHRGALGGWFQRPLDFCCFFGNIKSSLIYIGSISAALSVLYKMVLYVNIMETKKSLVMPAIWNLLKIHYF